MQKLIPADLSNPPGEYSVMPFWFWNDELNLEEILRQMDDFQKHGVDGFVIQPRIGLPRHLGWMSDELLGFYRAVIEEARRRQMTVILYDEGMYPSGSSSGQVVTANPAFACRCLAKVDLLPGQAFNLKPDETLVAIVERLNGSRAAVIDRPTNSVVRGLHYVGDGPAEDEPPAADLLNPQSVEMFIQLVYDRFAEYFRAYFGSTILAIFTDEPGLLGRSREREIWPGTSGILAEVNRILGYDFTPHLAALWYDDEPEAQRYRRDYSHAVRLRLEETYYQPLHAWCEKNGLALTGHPGQGDDIGALRYFDIPGQDLVWRWVLPDQPSALEGAESTQAKCASSAMLHAGRRRNANECCGAYGHELTWEEMNWLARWTFVRGANLLIPHAFYYSVRGLRKDERPPDVGPNSLWWDRFPEYALEYRRLSWINTDSRQVCHLAILGQADFLPWRAAKICYRSQYDFNYVEERDILEKATVDASGIHLGDMVYAGLILEHKPAPPTLDMLNPLLQAGRVFYFDDEKRAGELIDWLAEKVPQDMVASPPAPALRVRHVVKDHRHFVFLFNEERKSLDVAVKFSKSFDWVQYDAVSEQILPYVEGQPLHLDGYELIVLLAEGEE